MSNIATEVEVVEVVREEESNIVELPLVELYRVGGGAVCPDINF